MVQNMQQPVQVIKKTYSKEFPVKGNYVEQDGMVHTFWIPEMGLKLGWLTPITGKGELYVYSLASLIKYNGTLPEDFDEMEMFLSIHHNDPKMSRQEFRTKEDMDAFLEALMRNLVAQANA